jgi:hypothetical protein
MRHQTSIREVLRQTGKRPFAAGMDARDGAWRDPNGADR